MIATCEQTERVHLFADGELEPADAEQFRAHLAGCAACQRELDDVLQLEALGSALRPQDATAPAPRLQPAAGLHAVPAQPGAAGAGPEQRTRRREEPLAGRTDRARRRRLGAWIAAGSSALAAAAVFLVVSRSGLRNDDPYHLGEGRPIEARLTHEGAREWRRYDVARAAGPAAAEVPLSALVAFEQHSDWQGLASGYLLRGDRAQAKQTLARAPASADADSDRAAVALAGGSADEALLLLDGALTLRPGHPQATWNRGLALSALGLPLAAAEAFAQVALLGEPGWSQEAGARATALQAQMRERRAAWDADNALGLALAQGGPLPAPAAVRRHPGIFRLFFYDALRCAPTAERARALLPLAAQLDQVQGGAVLQAEVQRVAQADFAQRGPLAAAYLVASKQWQATGAVQDGPALLARLTAAHQPDQILGAMLMSRAVAANLEEYRKLAAELNDPWFAAIAAQEQAKALRPQAPLEAERVLLAGLREAQGAGLAYRSIKLGLRLADLYADLHRVPEAWSTLQEALRTARAGDDPGNEDDVLAQLATVARLRWAFALSRAYVRETLLRHPDECGTQSFAHVSLANVALFQRRLAEARSELDAAPLCGQPMPLPYALLLADVSRIDPRPGDEQRLHEALETLRTTGAISAGGRALADHIEGRLMIARDRTAGRALLKRAIAAGAALPDDLLAIKARAYSYATLATDEARGGHFGAAIDWLAEEASVSSPQRCAVGAAVDDEPGFVAVRGAHGEELGSFEEKATAPLDRYVPAVPQRLIDALAGCAVVDLLARPPLQGRALLPPELAWRYRTRPGPAPESALPPRHLVISDVEPPASLGLPHLAPWATTARPGEGREELRGAAATPARALQEMEQATTIEIHAHGLVDVALSDASLIALSPGADGAWSLSAAQVRAHRLAGAPLVLLAACRAATFAPQLHAGWSLPVAFLQAGARAVFASPADIPDAGARAFFDGVQERIRAGAAPAVALRDQRMATRALPGGSWADSVLLFE